MISKLIYNEYLQTQQDDMVEIVSEFANIPSMNNTVQNRFQSSLLPDHFIQLVQNYLNQHLDRYLIVTCRTGIGNRLQTIISAFLMAILMHRRLIIDWPDTSLSSCQFHRLFESHVAFSTRNLLHSYTQEYILKHGTLLHFHGPFDELLCHKNLTHFHQHVQFVFVKTDEYFMSVLMKNPTYSRTVFRNVSEDYLFRSFLNYLFVPIKEIREKIHTLTQQLGKCDRGLQLRKEGLKQISSGGEERFLKCALNQSAQNNETWLVVSDHPPYKQYIKSNVPSNRIQVWAFDTPTNPRSCSNVQHAVAEMWILSECRHILITEWSSFGWLAASRTGIHPMIVSKTSCHIQPFSRPCYYELIHLKQLSCYNYENMLENDGCCRSEGFCKSECLHHSNKYGQWQFFFLMLWPVVPLTKWFIKWLLIITGVILFIHRLTGKFSWIVSPLFQKTLVIGIPFVLIIYVEIRCLLWKFLKYI